MVLRGNMYTKTSYLINRQEQIIEEDKKYWERFQELSDSNDYIQFFVEYKDYLEKRGLESTNRVILHKMIGLLNEDYRRIC